MLSVCALQLITKGPLGPLFPVYLPTLGPLFPVHLPTLGPLFPVRLPTFPLDKDRSSEPSLLAPSNGLPILSLSSSNLTGRILIHRTCTWPCYISSPSKIGSVLGEFLNCIPITISKGSWLRLKRGPSAALALVSACVV